MKTIKLTFKKKIKSGKDSMNNPVYSTTEIEVDGCLIAPITEPVNAREQQAIAQSKEQLRIHLPKTFNGDVSNSDVEWDGKKFHVDNDSVVFMAENTPTQWNRYFRAERING